MTLHATGDSGGLLPRLRRVALLSGPRSLVQPLCGLGLVVGPVGGEAARGLLAQR